MPMDIWFTYFINDQIKTEDDINIGSASIFESLDKSNIMDISRKDIDEFQNASLLHKQCFQFLQNGHKDHDSIVMVPETFFSCVTSLPENVGSVQICRITTQFKKMFFKTWKMTRENNKTMYLFVSF
jgi:hypothetical protein